MKIKTYRDMILTRAMGNCWHEFDPNDRYNGVIYPCKHCGDEYFLYQLKTANRKNKYSNWQGFGILWTWASTYKVKTAFGEFPATELVMRVSEVGNDLHLINPDKFADALYETIITNQGE